MSAGGPSHRRSRAYRVQDPVAAALVYRRARRGHRHVPVAVAGSRAAAAARSSPRSTPRFPGIRFRMVDEQGKLRPHIAVFVGQRRCARPGTRWRPRHGGDDRGGVVGRRIAHAGSPQSNIERRSGRPHRMRRSDSSVAAQHFLARTAAATVQSKGLLGSPARLAEIDGAGVTSPLKSKPIRTVLALAGARDARDRRRRGRVGRRTRSAVGCAGRRWSRCPRPSCTRSCWGIGPTTTAGASVVTMLRAEGGEDPRDHPPALAGAGDVQGRRAGGAVRRVRGHGTAVPDGIFGARVKTKDRSPWRPAPNSPRPRTSSTTCRS